jgi:hypothetical protein
MFLRISDTIPASLKKTLKEFKMINHEDAKEKKEVKQFS